MSISMGPFITCFLGITFLSGYLHMILYRSDHPYIYGAKIIFAGIAVIFLRMCIPVNFPFTYTIYSKKLLLPFADVVYAYIGESSYKVSDLLMLCWLVVAIFKLVKLCIQTIRLHDYLNAYTVTEEQRYSKLYKAVRKHCAKPIRIAIIPHNVSPAISGLIHPTIIFPKSWDHFSESELDYICMHEINHYKKHDLWIKMLLEIVSCIHWWNPFVYLMKKEYALTLELTNDYLLIQEHPDFNYINYARLILKIVSPDNTPAFMNSGELVSFSRTETPDINIRLSFILKAPSKKEAKKSGLFIHTMIICALVLISLLIVPDPDFCSPHITEDGIFEMEPENTYFIHTADGYEIYVDDTYIGATYEIPEDLRNYKIYEKGEPVK